jgi:outer membrane protein assembly factor BamB
MRLVGSTRLFSRASVVAGRTNAAVHGVIGGTSRCNHRWCLRIILLAAIAAGIASILNFTEQGTVQAADKPAAATNPATKSVEWASFRNGFDLLGIAHSTLPEKLELQWKFAAGEMVVSTAAIVDGRVYVASLNGQLFCLNRKTGEKIWSYRSITDPDPKAFAPGFKAAPTVTADTIYIGDEDGVFHAINRATGKVRWTAKSGAEIVSSASCYQDKVLFGSHDNNLYCLNTADGKQAWKFETQGPVNCTPAIVGNRTFVTGCDEHLRVINIDSGKEEIDIHLATYLIASPAVVNETLYVGTYASEVVAIDWQAKKKLWAFKDDEREFPYHSCAAVTADRIIVGGRDKRLHCLDRKTGKQIWFKDTKGKVDSSPVVVGNRVFVGSEDGNLYGLNVDDGKEIWKFNAGKSISASPAVAEGCLIIGTETSDGFVYCFGAPQK